MLTYQLQERILYLPEGNQLSFPDDVLIEIAMEPPVPFGGVSGESRNVIADEQLRARFNFSTGRASVTYSKPLFDRLSAVINVADTRFEIEGNIARVRAKCTSRQDVHDLLSAVYYAFPAILNVYFPDAPIPKYAKGEIGGTFFQWIYEPSRIVMETIVTSKENQEQLVTNAWRNVALMSGTSNRRLIAGLHYYHVACRLLLAGNTKFEFLAEALLNFGKCLQSLFGESRDDVRTGITQLGKYSEDEIEGKFISALMLRNEFDVAHISMAMLNRDDLNTLHRYTDLAAGAFRELLKHVLSALQSGSYTLPKDPPLKLSSDKKRVLRRLKRNLNRLYRQ